MTGKSMAAALAALMTAGTAEAAPKVAADVAPVHSLVAAVMAGVGEPALILPPGASPHGHAMRPSEAAAVESADIVFWIGAELTPWLADALETLAPDARHVALLTAPGVRQLEFREGVTFEAHDHGDDHGHGHEEAKAESQDAHAHDDEHAHDDDHTHDDDHAHGDEHAHDDDHAHDGEHAHGDDHAHGDEHAHGHEEAKAESHDAHAHDHDHAHDGLDPHAWLDPVNGAAMLDAIAAALSEADPANAAAYAANAAEARAGLAALTRRLTADLAPLAGKPFVVFHDAYHHFEARFGVEAAGAVSLGDASDPGPRRLSEIREAIASMDAACVFTEPQLPTGLAETAAEGTGARLATLDPLGFDLAPGPALYPALIESLAADLRACLAPQG